VPGDNIGMNIKDTRTGKTLFYAPGLGVAEPHVLEYMANADVVFVDGTVWTDDEMSLRGVSDKRAQEMGHLDQSSKGGIMDILTAMDKPQKFLIHINNTNPILNENSPQRKTLEAAGIGVCFDGMELEL
jgi:pyrroloquinoline quinone biosynthesis protein B